MGGSAASQQADPAMQQITEFVSTSINNGEDPVDVVVSLVGQEVDQETIAQIFMQAGYAEEDVIALFEQVQQKMQPPGPASPEQQTQDPQEIARNEAMTQESQMQQAKSGIEIKPENKGKFTKWADARGMSVSEAANKVMSNTEAYPPSVVKMANFAKNAAGWNKKEGGEQKAFKPHFMYKGDRKIRAKDIETHLRLKEAGYGHDAPKAQTGLEVDKKGNRFINGVVQARDEWTAAPNYVNPLAFESGNNFSVTDGLQVLGTGVNKMFGSGDKNEDGLKDGFFRDLKRKKALRNLKKGDYYNYKIETDPNDPNTYTYDNLDLYNASKNKGGLRDLQTFTDDVKENSRLNYNTETGKYDALISSRELDNDVFGKNPIYKLGKNFNYFDDIDADTRQQIIDYGNASANGMPEGTTLSIDPETGAISYPLAGVDNPNEYNTMMGYNTFGKGNTSELLENSTIPDTEVDLTREPSIMDAEVLNFKEWAKQDSFNRMGANAPQQYQDYLKGVEYDPTNDPTNKKPKQNIFNKTGQFFEDKYKQALPILKQGVNEAGEFISEAGEFVKEKVNDVEDFIVDKFGKKKTYKVGSAEHKALDPTSYKKWQETQTDNNKLKDGGALPKAQFGMFDFDFSMYMDSNKPEVNTYFEDLFSGKTDYMRDTQAVADAQLKKENPGLGPTPLEQSNLNLFTSQQQGEQQEEEQEINTFDDPTVKRTNKLQGGLNRFMDSRAMKGYTGVSEFAVQGARVLNNFFDDKAIADAQADNRNNMVADNLYAIKENPMLKRGAWDINTGTFGSEGQRTVRTNMGIAQEGGETATVDSLLLAKLIAAGADIEIL